MAGHRFDEREALLEMFGWFRRDRPDVLDSLRARVHLHGEHLLDDGVWCDLVVLHSNAFSDRGRS